IDRVNFYLFTVGRFQHASLTLQAAATAFIESTRSDADLGPYRQALDAYEIERVDMEQGLGVVLEWCWDSIAEPVLTPLGMSTSPPTGHPWPRMWWCPTGLLP